jgi:hypothetical protein
MSDNSNLDVSIRIQEKYELYFLSLTFIILGLSIQTSRVGSHAISDCFAKRGQSMNLGIYFVFGSK